MSAPPLDGCDVSRWNGHINWNQVATVRSLQVVIAEMGWRQEGRASGVLGLDPEYLPNVAGMSAQGSRWHVGHYLVPIGTAPLAKQTDAAISYLRSAVGWPLPANHGLMVDVEYPDLDNFGQNTFVNWFLSLQAAHGRPIAWYGEKWAKDPRIAAVPKIAADYSYGSDASTLEEADRQMRVRYAGIPNLMLHQWGALNAGAIIPGMNGARCDSLRILDRKLLASWAGYGTADVCRFSQKES